MDSLLAATDGFIGRQGTIEIVSVGLLGGTVIVIIYPDSADITKDKFVIHKIQTNFTAGRIQVTYTLRVDNTFGYNILGKIQEG